MRYPTSNTGTWEDFNRDWYIAQRFGEPTSYGYHEGIDINTRLGGDTDLGKEIKAIAKGRITYYHYASHPTSGFGRHLVYKITGSWGERWVMCSHMTESGLFSQQDINDGQVIGYVGKSGTQVAHLHFSIFKVDPATLRNGIDTIAKTTTELNNWWENPVLFIENYINESTNNQVEINDQTLIPLGGQWGNQEVQAIRSILSDQVSRLNSNMITIADLRSQIGSKDEVISRLNDKIKKALENLN